jgi:hypothetical protein
MTNESVGSDRRLLARIPWWVKLGGAILTFAYGVGILTDTVPPLPSDVMAIIYFAVAIGLFMRAVRLHRES